MYNYPRPRQPTPQEYELQYQRFMRSEPQVRRFQERIMARQLNVQRTPELRNLSAALRRRGWMAPADAARQSRSGREAELGKPGAVAVYAYVARKEQAVAALLSPSARRQPAAA